MKFFDTPTFPKHWRDVHKIFRHCETTKFRRKDVIHPVMYKVFRYPKFSETLEGCQRNFSALWDQKFSPEGRDTLYYTWNISITNFSETLHGCPLKFLALWDKKISTENCDTPYYAWNFSITQIIRNIIGCPRNFSALWNQNFSLEKRHTLYYTWNFLIPQILCKNEGMATKFFGTVRPKIFDGKSWYPLLYKKHFDTPISLKHCTDAHLIFRHCRLKNFWRKIVIPPTMHKNFR